MLLFDSAARHRERDARYTILTADPVRVFRINEPRAPCAAGSRHSATATDPIAGSDHPFSVLRDWQKSLPQISDEECRNLPPFFGGIAGLLSYELGRTFEHIPCPALDDFQTPVLLAGLFDWAIVWDHLAGTVTQYVLHLQGEMMSRHQRAEWITQRLRHPGEDGSEPLTAPIADALPGISAPPSHYHRLEPTSEVYSDFTRDQYTDAVRRVIEYIRAGDIFQANLSQRLLSPWRGTATGLYAAIRDNNAAPFCGLLRTEEFSVISASPERFLRVDRSGRVETRPIKGTRRRPRSPIADLYAGDELSTSEKDRSENIMIVDLLRNDLSKSCQAGTVRVTGLCEVERFETVLHLVSTVIGTLRDDCDVWDLLAGCFPGGSITGAPKIRAMEIIAELERSVRGAYCGSLFFLGPCGDFDSSILIRTFTLKNGWAQFPVGGGIVADSDPLDEYRETLHKASGMIRALRSR